MSLWTPETLRAFEEEVKQHYLQGKIRAPVHLSRGNEEQLIAIFQEVKHTDWVFSTYRSHYHALLKGIPREKVLDEILVGHSIHLTFPNHRFYSSAIVGGCLPIALGTALGMKRQGRMARVWCFVGDMASLEGAFHEATLYAEGFSLPINFVVECNGLSTNTPTFETWGRYHRHDPGGPAQLIKTWGEGKILCYCYDRELPHIGIGVWISFDGVDQGQPERSDVMS